MLELFDQLVTLYRIYMVAGTSDPARQVVPRVICMKTYFEILCAEDSGPRLAPPPFKPTVFIFKLV